MKKLNGVALAIALAAVAMGSIATPAMAQEREARQQKLAVYKDLFEQLKGWAKTNIIPQLRTWKGQLDGAMSADDLAKLNALRARATQLRKEAMAAGVAMHKAWKDEKYDEVKSRREQMKGFMEQRKALFEELKPLAEKYRSTLETIGADAKPKVASWKEEGKTMVINWLAAHKSELGDAPFPHLNGMHKMMGFHGGKRAIVARFMLWDGGDPTDQMEQFNGDGGGMPELD